MNKLIYRVYELLIWQKIEQKHHDSLRPNLCYFEALLYCY